MTSLTSDKSQQNIALGIFKDLGFMGADQAAIRKHLTTRSLIAVSGVDTVLARYLTEQFPQRFKREGTQMVLQSGDFAELAQAMKEFGDHIGRDPNLVFEKTDLVGRGSHLAENSEFLSKAQYVVLNHTQSTDFNGAIKNIVDGARNVPLMFTGLTGSGKSTLAADFGELMMAKRSQTMDKLIVYKPVGKSGSDMTFNDVEDALREYMIDVLVNEKDSKFRYLVLDDLHLVMKSRAEWDRLHALLNSVKDHLGTNKNSAIAITTEITPESAALRNAHRVQEMQANALWVADRPIKGVKADIIKVLTKRQETKFTPELATLVAEQIIESGITVSKETGIATDAINFGFVVDQVGMNLRDTKDPDEQIRTYVADKVRERFAAISKELATKRETEAQKVAQVEITGLNTVVADHTQLLDTAAKNVGALEERTIIVEDKIVKIEGKQETDEKTRAEEIARVDKLEQTVAELMQKIDALERRETLKTTPTANRQQPGVGETPNATALPRNDLLDQ